MGLADNYFLGYLVKFLACGNSKHWKCLAHSQSGRISSHTIAPINPVWFARQHFWWISDKALSWVFYSRSFSQEFLGILALLWSMLMMASNAQREVIISLGSQSACFAWWISWFIFLLWNLEEPWLGLSILRYMSQWSDTVQSASWVPHQRQLHLGCRWYSFFFKAQLHHHTQICIPAFKVQLALTVWNIPGACLTGDRKKFPSPVPR